MANPQCEDGYTKIANEILEALGRIRIPGETRQVLDATIRKIYGFRKREDTISLSQFCLATGLKRQNVARAIKQLESMRLISVIKNDDRKPQTFRINKDYTSWRPLSKKMTALSKMMTDGVENQQNQGEARNGTVIKNDDSVKSVIKNDAYKRNKENYYYYYYYYYYY